MKCEDQEPGVCGQTAQWPSPWLRLIVPHGPGKLMVAHRSAARNGGCTPLGTRDDTINASCSALCTVPSYHALSAWTRGRGPGCAMPQWRVRCPRGHVAFVDRGENGLDVIRRSHARKRRRRWRWCSACQLSHAATVCVCCACELALHKCGFTTEAANTRSPPVCEAGMLVPCQAGRGCE